MPEDHKQHVLDTLNHFRTTARGIASIAVGISDIRAYAKEMYGMKQPDVAVSLDYLIAHGWVEAVIEQRAIARGRAVIPTTSAKYKLSAQGMSLYDSESRFNALNRYAGINIDNIGGVVVVGNNNVVNNKYRDIYTHLDALEKQIKLSDQLPDKDKLDAAADIQTVKDQLSKDAPSGSIVSTAMSTIRAAADVAGAIDLWQRASDVIHTLIQIHG